MIFDSWEIDIITVALWYPNCIYSSILANHEIENARIYFNQIIGDVRKNENVEI